VDVNMACFSPASCISASCSHISSVTFQPQYKVSDSKPCFVPLRFGAFSFFGRSAGDEPKCEIHNALSPRRILFRVFWISQWLNPASRCQEFET
jgi:hypothetical protein